MQTPQKPAGCDGPHKSMAERSDPKSEVRGGGLEELSHVEGKMIE